MTGDHYEVERHYRKEREIFFGAGSYDVVDVTECDRAYAELMSGSLFGSKRLVHLDSVLFNSDWAEFIANVSPAAAGRDDRLFVVRDVGASLDRRKLAKLKKLDSVLFWHCDGLKDASQAFVFVFDYCRMKGIDHDRDALELLVKMVGNDRGLIASELDKLASLGKRITERFVSSCAFFSSGDGAHFVLYSALASGDEALAREQVAVMLSNGIPPLAVLSSIVKLLSTTVAGPTRYKFERNEMNESWIGSAKPKKTSAFMAKIYEKMFVRMGEERILNTIAQSADSLAAIRLSANLDIEKERVDRIVGEICRE